MSRPARVAVCVPSYAAEKYLAEALDSVLAQTETDWEMVIVDDASTDASFEIAQKYAAADPRITAFRNAENQGAAATWAAVIDKTTAPYVKLLCSDDSIRADCLERQLAVFDADATQQIGLVSSECALIAEDGSVIRKRHGLRGLKRSASVFGRRELVTAMLRSGANPLGSPSNVLFRRTALAEAGGFDPNWRFLIDLKAYVDVAAKHSIAVIREPIAVFRVSSSSWSAALARSQSAETRQYFRLVAGEVGVGRLLLWRGIIVARVLQTVRRVVTITSRRRSRSARP